MRSHLLVVARHYAGLCLWHTGDLLDRTLDVCEGQWPKFERTAVCARIAKAQAEVDDLTQALQEHPGARGMDLSEFLVSATGAEIRRACAKLGIRSDICFAAMMSKETPAPAKPETEHQRRVRECMERIATLPKLEQHKAMARASRSYSAPESCIQDYGCAIEGTSMRWPDGELCPLRQDGELPGGITFIEPPGNI